MTESKKYLLWLLFFYCLIRIPILLSPLEDISGEVSRAAIAYDLIHGLRLPFWDYSVDPYGLGSLLAGLYTVPFFWHFFSVVVWFWLWQSYFSLKKAFLITAFLVFSLPLITEYTLSNTGYHFEMILWMALSLVLFKKILEKKIAAGWGGWMLGLLGGFSSAMVLSNGVMVGVILFYLICFHKNCLKKSFFATYFLGFILGFSPLILFNWGYGWDGASFVQALFTEETSLTNFVTHLVVFFKNTLKELLFTWPLVIFYLFSLIYLGLRVFRKEFRREELQIEIFGFFFQIFLVVLNLQSKTVAYPDRYLFPMLPFIGMTLGLALESFPKSWRIAFVSLYLAAVIPGNLNLISFKEFGKTIDMTIPIRSEGDVLFSLENKFGHDLDLFWKKSRAVLVGENAQVKREFYEGLSKDIFQIRSVGDLEKALAYIDEVEPDLQSILYDRLGIALGFYCQFNPKILAALFKEYAIAPNKQGPVYAGFIQGMNWAGFSRPERMQMAQGICDAIPGLQQSFCSEGLRRLDP